MRFLKLASLALVASLSMLVSSATADLNMSHSDGNRSFGYSTDTYLMDTDDGMVERTILSSYSQSRIGDMMRVSLYYNYFYPGTGSQVSVNEYITGRAGFNPANTVNQTQQMSITIGDQYIHQYVSMYSYDANPNEPGMSEWWAVANAQVTFNSADVLAMDAYGFYGEKLNPYDLITYTTMNTSWNLTFVNEAAAMAFMATVPEPATLGALSLIVPFVRRRR